jgi:hypothetical protein
VQFCFSSCPSNRKRGQAAANNREPVQTLLTASLAKVLRRTRVVAGPDTQCDNNNQLGFGFGSQVRF